MKAFAVATLAAALFVGTAGATPHAAPKDPLKGKWLAAPVTITRLRALLLGAGYSPNEITQYIDASGRNSPLLKSFQYHLTFYRSNGRPLVIVWGNETAANRWNVHYDPRRYTLLPNHRVAFTWEKSRWVFSYRVKAKTLSLRAVTSTDPTKTPAEVRLGRQLLYEIAATSFHRGG
jgi:hypothetical protein